MPELAKITRDLLIERTNIGRSIDRRMQDTNNQLAVFADHGHEQYPRRHWHALQDLDAQREVKPQLDTTKAATVSSRTNDSIVHLLDVKVVPHASLDNTHHIETLSHKLPLKALDFARNEQALSHSLCPSSFGRAQSTHIRYRNTEGNNIMRLPLLNERSTF